MALVVSLSMGCAAGVSEDDFDVLEADVGALADRVEIEDLMKTMSWSMDAGDMEAWLSIWSDDIQYVVPQYGVVIQGKAALEAIAPTMIFGREERTFSVGSNIMIDVNGDTATGKDYHVHYGYPIDPLTGNVTAERAFVDGMHLYEFSEEDGVWKITRIELVVHRMEPMLQQ